MMQRQQRRADRGSADDGFTLVELLVTMTIIGAVLLGLIGLQITAMGTMNQAKQRQQATAVGNQVLEQLRSLPFAKVALGHNPDGLVGDPYIQADGTFALAPVAEMPIQDNVSVVDLAPLAGTGGANETVVTDSATGASITARAYVTREVAAALDGPLNLSVVVDWMTSDGAKQEVFRSRGFAPEGCLAPLSRPFASPCQAYLYGDAAVQPGRLALAGIGGDPVLAGATATSVTVPLVSGRAGLTAEQTTSLTGRAVSSGANDQVGEVLQQQFGQVVASTLAGDDPAAVGGTPLTSTATMAQATGSTGYGPLVLVGTLATLTARPSSGDSGQLASSATGASCSDLTGVAMTGRPCSKTDVQQSGDASVELDLESIGGRDLPAFDLVTAAAPASGGASAWTGRYTTPGAVNCTSVSVAGCVAAGVTRKVGTLTAGRLPPVDSVGDDVPGSALVQLSGYEDGIVAETGAANLATAPTPSRTATLTYLTGAGSSTVTLTKDTSVSATLATGTGSYTNTSGTELTVSVTGVLTVKPVAPAAAPADPTCKATACVKEVTVPSILVTLTYTVQLGTTTPVQFDVTVDLGSAYAAATYKAAPSA